MRRNRAKKAQQLGGSKGHGKVKNSVSFSFFPRRFDKFRVVFRTFVLVIGHLLFCSQGKGKGTSKAGRKRRADTSEDEDNTSDDEELRKKEQEKEEKFRKRMLGKYNKDKRKVSWLIVFLYM